MKVLVLILFFIRLCLFYTLIREANIVPTHLTLQPFFGTLLATIATTIPKTFPTTLYSFIPTLFFLYYKFFSHYTFFSIFLQQSYHLSNSSLVSFFLLGLQPYPNRSGIFFAYCNSYTT